VVLVPGVFLACGRPLHPALYSSCCLSLIWYLGYWWLPVPECLWCSLETWSESWQKVTVLMPFSPLCPGLEFLVSVLSTANLWVNRATESIDDLQEGLRCPWWKLRFSPSAGSEKLIDKSSALCRVQHYRFVNEWIWGAWNLVHKVTVNLAKFLRLPSPPLLSVYNICQFGWF
jgi:hypothetical protein